MPNWEEEEEEGGEAWRRMKMKVEVKGRADAKKVLLRRYLSKGCGGNQPKRLKLLYQGTLGRAYLD